MPNYTCRVGLACKRQIERNCRIQECQVQMDQKCQIFYQNMSNSFKTC